MKLFLFLPYKKHPGTLINRSCVVTTSVKILPYKPPAPIRTKSDDNLASELVENRSFLRTFARTFSNIDYFLSILLLKDDELVMAEM